MLCAPCTSATLTRNWFLSSNTRFRPFSMKSSKRDVNAFIRLRKSSKPKLTEGSWSAMLGASCEEARIMVLMLSEGSNVVILGRKDAVVV
jgi:hypothetical protein